MIFRANLSHYEKQLQQKYDVSTSIWHKGERGRQRENGLLMFLRETLPETYGVATGEIFPFVGPKPSPQCDIIIYDKLKTLVFGRNDAVQQIPLEGVYAVIETKSTLDAKAISDAAQKFEAIKKLPRCSNKTRLKKGCRRGPVFYLFGYKRKSSKQACERFLRDNLAAQDVGIVALDCGLGIYLEQDDKPVRPLWLDTSLKSENYHETLMYFLLSLLMDIERIDLGTPNLMEWTGDK